MIPLRDVIPSRTFPLVSVTLVGLNAAAFAYQQLLPADARVLLAGQYGLTPASLAWWTLVTGLFLHTDWLQFGSNAIVLWLFGENVEDRTGRARMLLLYLLGGMIGGLVHAWTQTDSRTPVIGASASVACVLGAYFRLFPRSRVLTFVPLPGPGPLMELPAVSFLGFWVAAQLMSGLLVMAAPGIPAIAGCSFTSCAVAFLSGALLIRALKRADRMRVEWWHQARSGQR